MAGRKLAQRRAQIAIGDSVRVGRFSRLYGGMQGQNLQASFLGHSEQSAAGTSEFGDAADEAPGELGQAQGAVDFASQFDQRLGTPPVNLGEVQIASNFQRHGSLVGEGAGAANILLRNPRTIKTVENAEHPQNLPAGAQQRDGEKLMDMILGHDLDVDSWRAAGLIRPKDFFGAQGLGGNALWKQRLNLLGHALFHSVANPKLIVLEKRDEAAPEAKKIRGADHKGL